MSMLLEEVAAYLTGIGVPEPLATWHIKFMPTLPDKINYLGQYGGSNPELGFGTPGLKYETPGLQVKIRGEANDEDEPEIRIQKVFQALPKIQARTITSGSAYYHLFTPQQSPFKLQREEGTNRVIWAVNFLVRKELHSV